MLEFLLSDGVRATHPHLRALPGYLERHHRHVLRLSGFGSDDALRQLLSERFPQWLTARQTAESSPDIILEPDREFAPLTAADQPDQALAGNWDGYLHRHSDTLAGVAYIAGGLGMFRTALRQWRRAGGTVKERTELFKVFTSLCYTLAAGNIAYFTRRVDKSASVDDILTDIDRQLSRKGDIKAGELLAIARQHPGVAEQANQFLESHPWEVSALLNSLGSLSHVANTARKFNKDQPGTGLEFLSAITGLTSVAIRLFIPRHGQNSIPESLGLHGSLNTVSQVQTLKETFSSYAFLQPIVDLAGRFGDWLRQRPLNIAGRIAQLSNIGYGISGLLRREPDPSYLTTTIPYLVGDQFTAMSQKQTGIGLDEAVNGCARYIEELMRRKVIAGKDDPDLDGYIRGVVRLARQRSEIMKAEAVIIRGVRTQLGLEVTPPTAGDDAHQGPQQGWRISSPFMHELARLPAMTNSGLSR